MDASAEVEPFSVLPEVVPSWPPAGCPSPRHGSARTHGSSAGRGTAAAAIAAAPTTAAAPAADAAACDPMASAMGHKGSRSQPISFPSCSATNVVEGATLRNRDKEGVKTKRRLPQNAQAKQSKHRRMRNCFSRKS